MLWPDWDLELESLQSELDLELCSVQTGFRAGISTEWVRFRAMVCPDWDLELESQQSELDLELCSVQTEI